MPHFSSPAGFLLTGLPNRRALDGVLVQECERVRRGGPAFALVALVAPDLDHLKRIEDTYGHAAGDAVQKQAGQRLQATVRRRDTVARTGGEEFVVLAPAAGNESAPVLPEEHEPRLLIKRADAALYRAKEGGRHRVCRARRPRPVRA